MRTKRIVTALLASTAIAAAVWAKPVQLKSPDGRNVVEIETDGEIRVYFYGNTPMDGVVTVSGLLCDVFMNIQ